RAAAARRRQGAARGHLADRLAAHARAGSDLLGHRGTPGADLVSACGLSVRFLGGAPAHGTGGGLGAEMDRRRRPHAPGATPGTLAPSPLTPARRGVASAGAGIGAFLELGIGRRDVASNAETVIDLDRKRMQAMSEKDLPTLEALLADDLIYTHS